MLEIQPFPRRSRLPEEITADRCAYGYEERRELEPEQTAARVAPDLLDLRVKLVDLALREQVLGRRRGDRATLGAGLQGKGDRGDPEDDSQDEDDDNRLRRARGVDEKQS